MAIYRHFEFLRGRLHVVVDSVLVGKLVGQAFNPPTFRQSLVMRGFR
jgi:hypothetical protein